MPRPTPVVPPPQESKVEPPDGKWLVDERGLEYFTTEVPRHEGAYAWVDEDHKRIRVPFGLVLDVVSYDEEKFVVKIYKPVDRQPTPERPGPDIQAIEGSYRFTTATVDRLELRPFDQGLPRQGQWRQGFDVADIDGDGRLDIVHGPARKTGPRPAIFLGDGRGGWRRWAAARFPAIPFDYGDAAVGDLDGDGHPDLVLASHLRGITAMRGDGQGGFTAWSKGLPFGSGADADPNTLPFSSREIELADWNGDGRLDVLAIGEGLTMSIAPGGRNPAFGGESKGVVVYLNQGDGSWVDRRTPGSATYGDDLVVADFNGDGRPDLATGSANQGSRALIDLGRPDGTYEPQILPPVREKATVRGIAAEDFDGDGHSDLAIGYLSIEGEAWRTGVDVLLARGAAGWERRVLFNEKSQDDILGMAAGDLDGDGALDLVALTGMGQGWVFLGDGKGGFARENEPGLAQPGCGGYHVRLVDLDGDGRVEVVAGFAGEEADLMGRPYCPSGGSLRAWTPVLRR